jgi:nucleoside-diphosphate-sugar epimerase
MKVAVTGATGFVGTALVRRFAADGHTVHAAARDIDRLRLPAGATPVRMRELGQSDEPLMGRLAVDVVVHAAARVHVMDDRSDSGALFRAVNVVGSLALARQARDAGTRRFIYLSSVKAMGERSEPGHPLTIDTEPAPCDDYGRSKLDAERALASLCSDGRMELVIVRPPLVYGAGVGANFERLMRAIRARRLLPLGRLDRNRRSLVALENLVDCIARCAVHAGAPGRTFLVSDGDDLSTRELVVRLARALSVAPRLLPVPEPLLRLAGTLLGRGEAVRRLCDSLQVDISEARRRLGWTPPLSVDDGLRSAVRPLLEAV